MPSDIESVPQLPPIPPQTPFAPDQYPWERHYPSTSWSAITTSVDAGRSASTSPGSRLRPLPPVPPLPITTGSTSLVEVVSPPPRSQSRSHSRSGSRVLVLPSASTAEPIVISPPARTHSRSASATMSKIPPRPTPPVDPAGTLRSRNRTKSRPLPLPLPPKDTLVPTDRILVRTESLPLPKVAPASAPGATQPTRHVLRSQPETVPVSAPVRRAEPPYAHARSGTAPAILNAEQPIPLLDVPPPIPASAPVRAPTPPRPKARPGLPATPRRQDDRRGVERGRSPQTTTAATTTTTVVVRSSPGRGLEQGSSPRAKRSGPSDGEYARKWVLEKKGKRMTQDSIVVAQQLRLLR